MIRTLNHTLANLNDDHYDFEEIPNVSDIIWTLLSSNAKKVKDVRRNMNYPLQYSSWICLHLRGYETDEESDDFNVWRS